MTYMQTMILTFMPYALHICCKDDNSTVEPLKLLHQSIQHSVISIPLQLAAAKPRIRSEICCKCCKFAVKSTSTYASIERTRCAFAESWRGSCSGSCSGDALGGGVTAQEGDDGWSGGQLCGAGSRGSSSVAEHVGEEGCGGHAREKGCRGLARMKGCGGQEIEAAGLEVNG